MKRGLEIHRTRHYLIRLAAAASALCAVTARAQSTDVVAPPADPAKPAQIQSLSREEAEQERLRALLDAAPKAYQDNFLVTADAAAAEAQATAPPSEGLRSYLAEFGAGFDQLDETGYGKRSAGQFGLRTEYRSETLNYGDFILQADVRNRNGDPYLSGFGSYGIATDATGERIALRNSGLPLTDRTFADTTLGDTWSQLTDALSRTYRLAFGSDNVRGFATRLSNPDFDLTTGYGERGYLIGGPYPGFEKSDGVLAWLGYTARFDNDRFAGVQVNRASGVASYFDTPYSVTPAPLPAASNLFNVTSWAASVGYGNADLGNGDTRGRAILLGSRSDTPSGITVGDAQPATSGGDAHGLFLEETWHSGRYTHEFGAYAADPNLYFGDYQLTTGNRGAYWRVDNYGSRLNWGAGVDFDKSLPQLNGPTNTIQIASTRIGLSGNFQYQFDRYTSLGASLNVSDDRYDGQDNATSGGGSRSLYGNVFYQTRWFDWPLSRFNLTLQRNEQLLVDSPGATGQELDWEQQWIGGKYETMQPEFTTTLGFAHDTSSGTPQNYPTAGVQFRYWLDSDFNVGGNLRYTSQSGGLATSRGLSGNLNLERAFAQHWRVGVAAGLNQARIAAQQNSLTAALLSRSDEKSVFMYLRFEGSSGSGFQLAGSPSASPGGGRISGTVFLDANRDGEQQTDERGAANIEVLLDGRFHARTDAQGRFEFPMVTTGHHRLSLNLETVPLPWGVASEQAISADVALRGQAIVRIPIVRVSE